MKVRRQVVAERNRGTVVVLVNWKGWCDTIECLDSLLKLERTSPLCLAVVDNASSDESVSEILRWMQSRGAVDDAVLAGAGNTLKERLTRAAAVVIDDSTEMVLLCNRANDGFAAANNLGIRFGLDARSVDYVWILNNDTRVDSAALRHLCSRMAEDESIGICGATLVHADRERRVQAYGGVHYSLATARGAHIGAGDVYSGPIDNAQVEKCMTYVSGASMFVRREFIEEVGLMAEQYFLYNEEVDWAWRARNRYRLGVETAALVFHKEGASIGTETAKRPASLLSDFFQTRNKLMFAWRYTPWFVPTVWLSLATRMMKRWCAGQNRNAWLMLQVLVGRRRADPAWFVKGEA